MRIRIFQAFASNNSGSYTLVGSFRDAAAAEEVARLIEEVSDAHHAWHEAHEWDEDGTSPLDDFVRREGLHADKPGRGDAWPQHGPRPSAVASGRQVLVHAPYTVTIPAVFGELFYAKGGRVVVELDHAHADVAVEFEYRVTRMRWDDPKASEVLDAFEARAAAALPAWTGRSQHDNRPAVAPAWHRGFFGSRHLSVVFRDVVEGVLGVRAVAREAGVGIHLRIAECPHGVADPFAALRAPQIPWGRFRVILWQIGPARVAAMKAVREALGTGLAEAKDAIADLPREVLVDVDEATARRAAEVLAAAGCEAEVVAPATRGDR